MLERFFFTISDQDLQHVSLVSQEFYCKTLGNYHDLYLHTDNSSSTHQTFQ